MFLQCAHFILTHLMFGGHFLFLQLGSDLKQANVEFTRSAIYSQGVGTAALERVAHPIKGHYMRVAKHCTARPIPHLQGYIRGAQLHILSLCCCYRVYNVVTSGLTMTMTSTRALSALLTPSQLDTRHEYRPINGDELHWVLGVLWYGMRIGMVLGS